MTSNSLTENEEYDIPSQILRQFLDYMPQLILDPNMGWFVVHLQGPPIPNSRGHFTELIIYIIPPE